MIPFLAGFFAGSMATGVGFMIGLWASRDPDLRKDPHEG